MSKFKPWGAVPMTDSSDDDHDADVAFRSRGVKAQKTLNKEQAALGVFGPSQDSSSQYNNSRSLRYKGLSFVNKGIQNIDHESSASDGVASKPGFVPRSASYPVLDPEMEAKPTPPIKAAPSAFTKNNGKNGKALSFAERQMLKMGWKQGQGLGRDNQGRSSAIEAYARPQGLGLGAVNEKPSEDNTPEVVEKLDSGWPAFTTHTPWGEEPLETANITSNIGKNKDRAPKPKFQTQPVSGWGDTSTFANIRDMSSPGGTFITSSQAMAAGRQQHSSAAGYGELQDRLALLDRDYDRFIAQLRFEAVALHEKEELKRTDEEKLKACEELDSTLRSALSILEDTNKSPKEKWDEVTAALASYTFEDSLMPYVLSVVVTAMKSYAQDWDVLKDPTRFAAEIARLPSLVKTDIGQDIFENCASYPSLHRNQQRVTTYESLIDQVWLPKVRVAVHNWKPHRPGPMLELFDAWSSMLPHFVRVQFLELITRKLERAISKWNPKRFHAEAPPNKWVFCWIPHLDPSQVDPTKQYGLLADVKRKWRRAIDHWDLSNGVIPGLAEWKPAMSRRGDSSDSIQYNSSDEWSSLMLAHLIPKLRRHLAQGFRVDPSNQAKYLPVLRDVLCWEEVVSSRVIGEIIVVEVFPQLHLVLWTWLKCPPKKINYDELAEWLQWWLDRSLPSTIRALPSVTAQFNYAIKTVDQAIKLHGA